MWASGPERFNNTQRAKVKFGHQCIFACISMNKNQQSYFKLPSTVKELDTYEMYTTHLFVCICNNCNHHHLCFPSSDGLVYESQVSCNFHNGQRNLVKSRGNITVLYVPCKWWPEISPLRCHNGFEIHQNWSDSSPFLVYYHHQIASMNYSPLFRVRSWNNGMRCMSIYILMVCTCGHFFTGTGFLCSSMFILRVFVIGVRMYEKSRVVMWPTLSSW